MFCFGAFSQTAEKEGITVKQGKFSFLRKAYSTFVKEGLIAQP